MSSLEGSDMEYVDLPSSEGDYEDTDLDEEVVPGQNEDEAFVYYGDYNDQILDDIEHAVEYEHDGDGDKDYDDEDDYDDDEDDEEDDSDDDVSYDDAGIYDDDDDDVEA
ncbi:calsequestrin-1-like [Papaver somniferum]|uniref:calsequestrin-1-like n=1 Tax=Papaver somniferum TaxID=3469 RepID=UPI000E6FF727|nr:calsequestrin-1-like [Papaver somniferum]